MILSSAQPAAAVWVERYETLRRHVLGEPFLPTIPLSLTLWLAHGMAGWMHHWAIEKECSARLSPPPPPRYPATTTWQGQLTRLLAQMTTQHLQTVL